MPFHCKMKEFFFFGGGDVGLNLDTNHETTFKHGSRFKSGAETCCRAGSGFETNSFRSPTLLYTHTERGFPPKLTKRGQNILYRCFNYKPNRFNLTAKQCPPWYLPNTYWYRIHLFSLWTTSALVPMDLLVYSY